MPRKRKSPDDNAKAACIYTCNCDARCGGTEREVSKTTHHEHAPFRMQPLLEAFKKLLGKAVEVGKGATSPKKSGTAGKGKRRRLEVSVCAIMFLDIYILTLS